MRHSLTLTTLALLLCTPFLALGANPGDVIINEVMQNPSAVSDYVGEWLELVNMTGSVIDVNGWIIKDEEFNEHTIDNGGPLYIDRYGYLVLGCNGVPAENGGYTPDYVYPRSEFILENGDDTVFLVEGATVISEISYDGGPVWPDPIGASMGWIGPPTDYTAGGNWTEETVATYGDGDYGTPGSLNSDSSLPVELSAFYAEAGNGQIEVVWTVESEINNSAFNILRSTARNGDYVTIYNVPGRGNASNPFTYSCTDRNVKVGIEYWYKLETISFEGRANTYGPVSETILSAEKPETADYRNVIRSNYPNPFNPTTTLRFELENETAVSVRIYDHSGKVVRTLVDNEVMPAGANRVLWNGKSDDGETVASGVYFSSINSDDFNLTGKMLLVK